MLTHKERTSLPGKSKQAKQTGEMCVCEMCDPSYLAAAIANCSIIIIIIIIIITQPGRVVVNFVLIFHNCYRNNHESQDSEREHVCREGTN